MIGARLIQAPRQPRFIHWLVAVVASLACAAALADDRRAEDVRVLCAYLGDSVLPSQANLPCTGPWDADGDGFGGMPLVFGAQIDPFSHDPGDSHTQVLGQPGWVTPVCATLNPAVDPSELRTVLLVGDFGLGGTNRPVAIKVVGDLQTTDRESLQGLVTRRVSGTDIRPQLVLAERLTPDGTDCPGDTPAGDLLTFSGGPTGPHGDPLDANDMAMEAVQVVGTTEEQRTVPSPFELGDIDSHVFFGPQNGPDRAGAVLID